MNTTDQLSVNTLRFLAVDMVQQANRGHPGLPLGAAPMAYVLCGECAVDGAADSGLANPYVECA